MKRKHRISEWKAPLLVSGFEFWPTLGIALDFGLRVLSLGVRI